MGEGISGHQLAMAVAIGTTIGILPTLWGTSLLCLLLAWLLGLNPVVVQTVNFLVYPLQVCLFIPFALWGRKLFPTWFESRPDAWLSLQAGWHEAGSTLLPFQMAALLGWAMLIPGTLAISYGLAFCIPRCIQLRQAKALK